MSKNILIFIVLIQFNYCKSDFKKNIIRFDYNNSNTLVISDFFSAIEFLPLDNNAKVSKQPNRFKQYKDRIFLLWNSDFDNNKLAMYDLKGKLINKIEVIRDSKNDIEAIYDFEVENDTLYLLSFQKILTYHIDNLATQTNKIELPEDYFSITKIRNGFLCYSATQDHWLSEFDFNGKIIKKHFSTLNKYPSNAVDLFPHFSRYKTNTLFYSTYDPTIYQVNFNSGAIDTLLQFDLDEYQLNNEELLKLIKEPENRQLGRVLGHSHFNFFHNCDYVKNGVFYMFQINEKVFYNFYSFSKHENAAFTSRNNDTNIPFMNKKGHLHIIGSDGDECLIAYVDPELVLELEAKGIFQTSQISVKTNWNQISKSINAYSGPVLAFLKVK